MLFVGRAGDATAVVEKIIRVEGFVAHEIVSRAVKSVCARLGSEAHDPAASLAEFGFEAVGIDSEFGDGFDRGCVIRNPVGLERARRVGGDAIEIGSVTGGLPAAQNESSDTADV